MVMVCRWMSDGGGKKGGWKEDKEWKVERWKIDVKKLYTQVSVHLLAGL